MISSDEIKQLAGRWKRASRPLKIQDQKFGLRLAEMIEKYNRKEFERFNEPLEAAAFIILMQIVKEEGMKNEGS